MAVWGCNRLPALGAANDPECNWPCRGLDVALQVRVS
jgi:hypothetical protein